MTIDVTNNPLFPLSPLCGTLPCICVSCCFFFRTAQKNPEAEEKEEEMTELRKKRDAQLEEEAQRLKEEVEKLRVEMEKLEESQKHWEERKEEDIKEEELDEEKRKEREEEKRKEEVEEIRREHKREMQSLVSEYSSAQSHLQARIVALENEWVKDTQITKHNNNNISSLYHTHILI